MLSIIDNIKQESNEENKLHKEFKRVFSKLKKIKSQEKRTAYFESKEFQKVWQQIK